MQTRAAEANCRIDWQLGEGTTGYFDPEGLHRAVLNLVSNAIDAVSESANPCVELRSGGDAKELWVEVSDNGSGIPEVDQKAIFAVFESRKGSRGTGLGLPVSRKILREHSGDIELTSVAGAGAKFRIWFPRRTGAESVLEDPETQVDL